MLTTPLRPPREADRLFFSAADAEAHRRRDGWTMVEEAGRGCRRVVPSPRPRRIVEAGAIRALLDADLVVIAAGGGGVRVIETAPGVYRGVEAVVDKDLASSLLTAGLGLPVLVLSTGVPKVAVWFRRPDQRDLDRVTVPEARRLYADGQFPPGSMGPKMLATIEVRGTGWARGDRDVPRSPGRRRGRSRRHACVPD